SSARKVPGEPLHVVPAAGQPRVSRTPAERAAHTRRLGPQPVASAALPGLQARRPTAHPCERDPDLAASLRLALSPANEAASPPLTHERYERSALRMETATGVAA